MLNGQGDQARDVCGLGDVGSDVIQLTRKLCLQGLNLRIAAGELAPDPPRCSVRLP